MSDHTVERMQHGEWGVVAALLVGGLGVAVGSPLLVAGATIPLWFVAATALGTRPALTLEIERRVSVGGTAGRPTDGAGRDPGETVPSGDPGDAIGVTVAVKNRGEAPLVDVRVADGVPATLPVVDGTPRTCVTLDSGETATFTYHLELRRGEHDFGEATVRTRDLTGTVAATGSVRVAGDDRVTCTPVIDQVPLGSGTNDYAGEVPSDEGGSGTEFFAVRDYQPGDPVGAIDWRRYAATRDLATVEYRAERATRIVCVVDARPSQFLRPADSHLSAAALSTDAARRTVETLSRAGHPTGVLTLTATDRSYVPPGTDAETRERAASLLAGVRDSSARRRLSWRESDTAVADIARKLPAEAQVYLFSSAVDHAPVEITEHLRARGYPVRFVSPDVTTGGEALGPRLSAVARDTRLSRLRASGARVVDWRLDRPLELVLRDAVGEVGVR